MDINITINAPEVCVAINNLVTALTCATAAHLKTPTIPTAAKIKLAPVVPEAPTQTATPPSANDPLSLDQVKTLAATKAKKVGAALVKGIIADTGAATIADISDPLVLASLAANLEAL